MTADPTPIWPIGRLTDMAEFMEGRYTAIVAESVAEEHAADLRWAVAEIGRLREALEEIAEASWPDHETGTGVERRDLRRIHRCEPGVQCRAARPERCRECAAHRAAVWPRKDQAG